MKNMHSELLRLKEDVAANKGNSKSLIIIIAFRIAKITLSFPRLFSFLFTPVRAFYKIIVIYVLGVDLPLSVTLGGGTRIYHGTGLVVHPEAIIGQHCILRHGVTIGNAKEGGSVPTIGSNVNLGCHCTILGDINIGDNVVVGAGAIVVKSIPDNCTVVGTSARIIKVKQ